MRFIVLILVVLQFIVFCRCSSLGYTDYVVTPVTQVNKAIRANGTKIEESQGNFNQKAMQVRYNDGKTVTEVTIPMLSSGQTVIIDNKTPVEVDSPEVVLPAPHELDKELEKKYISSGGRIDKKSEPVSLFKANGQAQSYIQKGLFHLALEIIEKVLKKYPDHAQFLRMKGSCLLSSGEKKSAIETYQKAYNIEPDAQLKELLDKLNNENRGN